MHLPVHSSIRWWNVSHSVHSGTSVRPSVHCCSTVRCPLTRRITNLKLLLLYLTILPLERKQAIDKNACTWRLAYLDLFLNVINAVNHKQVHVEHIFSATRNFLYWWEKPTKTWVCQGWKICVKVNLYTPIWKTNSFIVFFTTRTQTC